jgi:hypothetical protein
MGYFLRILRNHTKENDSALGRHSSAERQFSEILVEG